MRARFSVVAQREQGEPPGPVKEDRSRSQLGRTPTQCGRFARVPLGSRALGRTREERGRAFWAAHGAPQSRHLYHGFARQTPVLRLKIPQERGGCLSLVALEARARCFDEQLRSMFRKAGVERGTPQAFELVGITRADAKQPADGGFDPAVEAASDEQGNRRTESVGGLRTPAELELGRCDVQQGPCAVQLIT